MEAQGTSNTKILLLFFVAILITTIGGMLTGVTVAIVGSLIYLIFLFPLGMGLAGGVVVKWGIRLAKLRKISQGIFLSVLVAVSIYGTYHYGRYIIFRARTFVEMSPKLTKVSPEKRGQAAGVLLDYALVEETGHSRFVGYMFYKAQKGVSLGHVTSSDGINLGPALTWAYWLLELGLIFWMAMSIAKTEIQVPVCEVCGSRLGKEKHLGGTAIVNEPLLLELIRSRQFVELGRLIEKNEDLPSTELYMQRCEACQKGNSYVTVRRASRSPKGGVQLTNIQNVMLEPRDSVLFSNELNFNN